MVCLRATSLLHTQHSDPGASEAQHSANSRKMGDMPQCTGPPLGGPGLGRHQQHSRSSCWHLGPAGASTTEDLRASRELRLSASLEALKAFLPVVA
eukprot:290710-Hanusia_phi.AAC.1